MKKTLLVTLDFYPSIGGIASYWKNLGIYMSPEKWVVLAPVLQNGVKELDVPYPIYRRNFFSLKNCHSEQGEESRRFYHSHLRGGREYGNLVFSYFFAIKHIYAIAKKERIEKIIVGQILPVGSVVWLASKFLRIPYIISVHGMDIGLASHHWRKKKLCNKIFADAEYVIANSRYTGSLVCEYGVPKEKIEYIFPCSSVTSKLLQGTYSIPEKLQSKKIILSVGRLVRRKGFEYVIRALPEVLKKEPDAHLVILGNGPLTVEFEKLVQEIALQTHVSFIKNASDAELATWYNACAVFVMAPYEESGDVEGFGIVYLDANGFGKPVIGTKSGGVPEAVIDGKTGLLVTPKNNEEIAQAVVRVLSDKNLAEKLGFQGRERAEKEFQWSIQAEKLQKILE